VRSGAQGPRCGGAGCRCAARVIRRASVRWRATRRDSSRSPRTSRRLVLLDGRPVPARDGLEIALGARVRATRITYALRSVAAGVGTSSTRPLLAAARVAIGRARTPRSKLIVHARSDRPSIPSARAHAAGSIPGAIACAMHVRASARHESFVYPSSTSRPEPAGQAISRHHGVADGSRRS